MSTKQKVNFNASYTYNLKRGLCGNLGHKPELLVTQQGEPYAKVSMYCNFGDMEQDALPKDEPKSVSFVVTFFGALAEKVCDELNAGDFVAIQPNTIRFTKAVNEETGEWGYVFLASVVSQDNFNLLSRPSEKEGAATSNDNVKSLQKLHSTKPYAKEKNTERFSERKIYAKRKMA